MGENRSSRARSLAGLSVGQAAKLLGVDADTLKHAEEMSVEYAREVVDLGKLCDVYRVRMEWLVGDVDRHDYQVVDEMKGADKLTPGDRDVVAEFAALLPRKVPKKP